MALSVYVHIPYCLQRCRYCDFTTFEQSEIMPPEKYVAWLMHELRGRHKLWRDREIDTLYFGGGTPSLLPPDMIVAIRAELANLGFYFRPSAEITIEINPATLDEKKLRTYLDAGFNRFSVGAQSFNDRLLRACGRKHDAEDTRETLRLLDGLNYSFDLLFALPGQTLRDLELDLEEVTLFSPPHLSAYCLTVPSGHPMNFGRPPEDEQIEMFDVIVQRLQEVGLSKYEISNFAKPGFESRHNMAYWCDKSYWGVGLSSHSYRRDDGEFGLRFWNPKSLERYGEQVGRPGAGFREILPEDQFESLAEHEALTDFCHMHLRMRSGLPWQSLREKFPVQSGLAQERLDRLVEQGLVIFDNQNWRLSTRGEMISNRVFEELTFLREELNAIEPGQRPRTLTSHSATTYCALYERRN